MWSLTDEPLAITFVWRTAERTAEVHGMREELERAQQAHSSLERDLAGALAMQQQEAQTQTVDTGEGDDQDPVEGASSAPGIPHSLGEKDPQMHPPTRGLKIGPPRGVPRHERTRNRRRW